MRIGILTGGGDSSAINAAIRAVVRRGLEGGHQILGFKNGWAGPINGDYVEMTADTVSGILPRGGTILGTSRTNPFKLDGAVEKVRENLKRAGIDAMICIGGDDTLGVAHKLNQLEEPIPAVGIPQTIDNDINGTDFAIGFNSALFVATEALDRLHTTAESHHRIIVVEVMGRDAGHVALYAGLAGGADTILVPEHRFSTDEVIDRIKKRRQSGKTFSIIVVAEGARPEGREQVAVTEKTDAFGHVRLGGVGEYLANVIEERTGLETRSMNLGHLQRGGMATPFDRIIATEFGVAAVELVEKGELDRMVAIQCGEVTSIPLEEALTTRPIDERVFQMAQLFF
ncbi:MAG TPA: ATP-dependent 6-phosphofructokinase [Anaerolineae bacterium]|jgi:6-phosphofructokinase 1|nr:ATP-dependent 6-phosphofructokinase [Anaerolineae bacterium]